MSKERLRSAESDTLLPPEERFRRVVKIFSALKGDRLLDMGCGDGTATVALKRAIGASEAVGVDIDPAAVAAASRKGIEAFQGDISSIRLPYEDACFDAVYCGEVIEHLFDPDHLLEEIHRVLKPKGVCVMTTPNLAGWPSRLALLMGYQPYPMEVSLRHEGTGKLLLKRSEGQRDHIRLFTKRAFCELLRKHSFVIKHLQGCPVTVGNPPRVVGGFITMVDKAMSRFPSLATRIIAVIEKE